MQYILFATMDILMTESIKPYAVSDTLEDVATKKLKRSGEYVDTTLSAHMNDRETSLAWKAWEERHAADMRAFEDAGLAGPENIEWHNVVEHSLVVNAMAVLIARKLQSGGVAIDVPTVDKASLLHDVTKRKEREAGVSYDNEHEFSLKHDFLTGLGYDDAVIDGTLYTGRVEDMFIEGAIQRWNAVSGRPLEQLIVGYADARVRNTDIVSLEEARDRNKQKVPRDAAVYDLWYDFYGLAEDRIFSLMPENMVPADITNAAVVAMLTEYAD